MGHCCRLELAEVNLSQLSRATAASAEENESGRDDEWKEKTTNLTNQLNEKETELERIALENEEHVKRVAELTAYIQARAGPCPAYTSGKQKADMFFKNIYQQTIVNFSKIFNRELSPIFPKM